MEIKQNNSESKGEFIAMIDGQQAGKMTYSWAGDQKFIIDHTEIDPTYKGQGVGREMVYKAVEYARGNHLKIVPLCPFAKATFEKNKEIQDVL